jgi:prepilin-type processing-associated H-X9-DG protein
LAGGEFFFAFRHFQALADHLKEPKLLICPADTRLPAPSFPALKNENVSYFVALKAAAGQSDSLLCGDRNLEPEHGKSSTLVQLGPGSVVRWNDELHQSKGNTLFADGRVEHYSQQRLTQQGGLAAAALDVVFPTTVPATLSPHGPAYSVNTRQAERQPRPGESAIANLLLRRCGKRRRRKQTLRRLSHPTCSDAKSRSSAREMASSGGTPSKNLQVEAQLTNVVTSNISGPSPSAEQSEPQLFPVWLSAAVESLVRKGAWALYVLLAVLAAVTLVLRKRYTATGRRNRARRK